MKNSSAQLESSAPWPLAIGLLAASLTTMFGIVAGFEPETILIRCACSGVMVCFVATCVRSVWRAVTD